MWKQTTSAAVLAFMLAASAASAQEPAGASSPLRCESEPGQRQHCAADTSGGVAIARETGDTPCLLGKNWGYDSQGVWVSEGCSAEFTLGKAAPDEDGIPVMFEPYTRLRAHVAMFDDEAVVQDNGSWVGARFSAGRAIKLFAGVELGLNMIGGPQFSQGASTESGFLAPERADPDLFGRRLGYVGLDFGHAGRVTLGKQNAVHYDIAGYTTDRWNVFGGEASVAYPGASDGGQTGTGRIDQALTYRVSALKILDIGLQTQFRTENNDDFFDGFGASAQVTVLPGFKLGASYTKTLFSELLEEGIRGLGGDAEYIGFGARFDSPVFDVALVITDQTNGEATERPIVVPALGVEERIPVVFDATGVEIYAKAKLGAFSIIGGFIDYNPKTTDPLIDPNFRTRYGILGAEWSLARSGYLYAEARLDDSVTADGADESSVFTVGLHFEFSWKSLHRP